VQLPLCYFFSGNINFQAFEQEDRVLDLLGNRAQRFPTEVEVIPGLSDLP